METATATPARDLAPVHRPGALAHVAEQSPVSLMLALTERGASLDQIERAMDLQIKWEERTARAAFNEALANFKTEAITILKRKAVGYEDRNGNWVGYKHAELFDVVGAVGPVLARYGLSFRWDVKQSKDWISVTCILKHRLGHSESCEMGGPPDASGKKNSLQQISSTVSYLERYTLKAITGVAEGGEDDDGRGGSSGQDDSQGEQGATRATQADQGGQGLPAYPTESFEKNLPAWRKAIAEGRKTAEQVIATVESRASLTDEQKAQIRSNA